MDEATLPPPVQHVYIVDDDAGVREELADALDLRGFIVRGFADGRQFLDAHGELDPGCVVLDLNMPGMDGMEVQDALKAMSSLHKIVMLTGVGSVSTAVRAMHSGAVDYLEKPFHINDLVRAIGNAVARLEQDITANDKRRRAEILIQRLSEREREVMSGMMLGLVNKIIAYRLGLSTRTVEAYRAHVLEKLGVKSVAEVVQVAIDAMYEPKGDILRG